MASPQIIFAPEPTNKRVVQDGRALYRPSRKSPTYNAAGTATTGRVATYVWGPDIGSSYTAGHSMQSAGGVGGLLMVLDGASTALNNPANSDPDAIDDDYFPLMDRMGNVTAYKKASTTTPAAQLDAIYDYDAFGREFRSSGPAADTVPFHFSSKFTDAETGLNYYGYRYYDPGNGRWLGRDPIGEEGGVNLYAIVANRTINNYDTDGLFLFPMGPAGQWPPPGPISPSSPSPLNHLRGSAPEYDNKAWFEERLPKWVKFAKQHFRDTIGKWIEGDCPKPSDYEGTASKYDKPAYKHNDIEVTLGMWAAKGDEDASWLERYTGVGSFHFMLRRVRIRGQENTHLNSWKVAYEAEMYIQDYTGLDPEQPFQSVVPFKAKERGTWKLEGKVMCECGSKKGDDQAPAKQ